MANLLPSARLQFSDANGVPLAGGSVTNYIPGTTTLKDTYQDSGATIINANPITLDSAGTALIWGKGSYRQIVKDSLGNTISDAVTSDSGTPDALTVAGAATIGGTLGVTGAATIGGTLGVTGAATFTSGHFTTTLQVDGAATFTSGHFTSTLQVDGTATLAAALTSTSTLASIGLAITNTTSATTPPLAVSASGGADAANFSQLGSTGTNKSAVVCNVTNISQPLIFFEYFGTGVGSVSTNGSSVAYNTTSDYRVKTVSGPLTTSGALIDAVPVYLGAYNVDLATQLPMFLAHELAASVPSAVRGAKDAVDAHGAIVAQQVDHSALVPLLWAEIKALRARLTTHGF